MRYTMKPFNFFNFAYSLLIVAYLLLTLQILSNAREESKDKPIKHGCYNAPIYIYDERIKKYYKQDWCKSAKQPVFYDSIPALPVPSERVERRLS